MPASPRFQPILLTIAAVLQAATLLASDPARERQLQEGLDLLENNQPAAAARLFEEAARSTDPEVAARGLLYLGDAQRLQGMPDAARRTYTAVVERFGTQRSVVDRARTLLARIDTARPTGNPRSWLVVAGDDADPNAHLTLDGRLMSRTDWRTGDVVVRDMRSGHAAPLKVKKDTPEISPDHAERPMISPDGRKVVFVWVFRDDRNGTMRNQLQVMPNVPGAAPTVLFDHPDTYFEPIGWSQDGQSVLVTAWMSDGRSEFVWISLKPGSRPEVLRSMGQRLVLGRSRPRLSPDGTHLAYAAIPGQPTAQERQAALVAGPMHLYLLPLDGSDEIELVRGNINESPVWAPDGRRILFVSNRSDEGYSLWSVGVDNVERPDVSHVAARVQGRIRPVGMTRGGTFYYVPEQGGGFDVYLTDFDPVTGRVRTGARLVDTLNDKNLAPSWSPDGRRVAYKRRRMAGTVPRALEPVEVVVYSGGDEEGAFTFAGLDDGPALWLDPQYLLVRRVNGRLFRLNLRTGEFRPIESVAHSALPPECGMHALSPDGGTLYLSVLDPLPPGTPEGTLAARRRIVAFDLATGDQRNILEPQPFITLSVLAVAPDGRSLAISFMRDGWKAPRLAIASVDGTLRELPATIVPRAVSWTRAGLLVARGDTEQTEIVRVSIEDGTVKPTGLAHAPGLSFDISRDGSRVVYGNLTRSNVAELWGYENLLARARQVN